MQIILAVFGGVIALIVALAVFWTLQHKRELGAMSQEQKQRLNAVREQKMKENRLFWIPFVVLIALAGGIASALETSVGPLDVLVAVILSSLISSVLRRCFTRNEVPDEDSNQNSVIEQGVVK